MARPALTHLSTLEQYETLLSPARFEVFECMRFMSPCAISDLAGWLEKPADTLYQHVHQLVDIGVATSAGFRKSGKHTEELFDLTGDDVDFASLQPPMADKVMKLAAELFIRYARSTTQRALGAKAIRYGDAERNLIITNFLAWLTREEYGEIRALTKQIVGVINNARARQSGELYMCMNLVCPVVRRARGGKSKRARRAATSAPGTAKSKTR